METQTTSVVKIEMKEGTLAVLKGNLITIKWLWDAFDSITVIRSECQQQAFRLYENGLTAFMLQQMPPRRDRLE